VSKAVRDLLIGAAVSLLIGVALATGPPFWFKYVGLAHSATANNGVIRFVGGCAPFRVYAQTRWYPYGVAVRSAPQITAKQIGSKDPNQSAPVDGWVHAEVAYPTNTPPWNSDVWFHMADGSGWISFAGVRAAPTSQDPTEHADGGPPISLQAQCQGSAQ
jgi:hypothetical protein